jgi:hypothetical protein
MVKNWGAATAFLALVALVGVAAWFDRSAPYERCHGARDCGHPSKDHHKPTDYMAGPLAFGQFVDTHNGAVGAIATIMIAAFTILLAIRTGGLFKETSRLRAIAADQQTDFLRSIKATESLAEAAHKSAEVARAEFDATHRPHLIIRDVSIDGNNVVLLLINKGDASAFIVESWVFLEYIIKGQAIRPLFSPGHDDLGKISFTVGETKPMTWPLGEFGFYVQFPKAGKAIKDGDMTTFEIGDLYFAITIVYADSAGQRRRSVFRRRWDVESQRFCRLDDPDQEYSD